MILLLTFLGAPQGEPGHPPSYLPLRYEEDWSVLKNGSAEPDFLDPVKYVPLDLAGNTYFTFGGALREQMESWVHEDFGAGPSRDTYLLHRLYPYADFHAGGLFRAFVMFKNVLAFGTENPPSPSQKDTIDLHDAFIDLAFDTGIGKITFRPGRQEMLYGVGRLFDDRSGPNVEMTYDLARLILETGGLRFDAFYGRPVQPKFYAFDDTSRGPIDLGGIYGMIPLGEGDGVEPYVLYIERRSWVFDEGTGTSDRVAIGTRIFRPRRSGLDWNFEPILEVGKFGNGAIQAWGLYTDTGFTFSTVPGVPRLGCRADILSGDRRRGDGNLGTFDSFFPRGVLDGEAGSFGPANLISVTPEFTLQPLDPLYLSLRWTFYWRESRQDGLYTLNLDLYTPSGTSDASFVAHECSVNVDYYLGRHVHLSAVYSFTKTGPYLRDTGHTEDQTFVSATLRFTW
jgi:hypothetical protein